MVPHFLTPDAGLAFLDLRLTRSAPTGKASGCIASIGERQRGAFNDPTLTPSSDDAT
jgi:hypothetical protein